MNEAKLVLLEQEARDGTLATAIAQDGNLGMEMIAHIRVQEIEIAGNSKYAQLLRDAITELKLEIAIKDALLKEAREACRFIQKNAAIGKDYPKTPGGLACLSIYDAVGPLLAKLDALK